MQQQSNEQNKFLIDADIGDDDVTLPSLPVVNVPIVETKEQTQNSFRSLPPLMVPGETNDHRFFATM